MVPRHPMLLRYSDCSALQSPGKLPGDSLMSGLIPRNFNAIGLGCVACTSKERVPKVRVSTEAENHYLVMYMGLWFPRAAIRKRHKLGSSQ